MKKFLLPLLALSAVICAASATAECVEPADVSLPDGGTATTEEMVTGQANVKQYVIDAQAFLACMDEHEKAVADTATEEMKRENVERYNAMVDKMQAAAQGFNEQIKIYKAAQAAQ